MNNKNDIFEAFRRNIINKICPYLSEFNFTLEDAIKEESEWINAKFKQNEITVDFCVSLHHLDYADGIVVILKSTRGIKNLINEASINNSKETPVYLYFTDHIDKEFDRILRDLKLYFEIYFID